MQSPRKVGGATTNPVSDRQSRRKARTRAALVAAARQLFAHRGFGATSVAAIAEQADTGHGSFYNHFATKEEILTAVLEGSLTEQLDLLRTRHQGIEDPAERVSIGHRHVLAAARADPDWGWLILRLDIPYRVIEAVFRGDAMRDLQEGIESGRFSVTDPTVSLLASGGSLIGIMHLILRESLGEDADIAHAEGVLRSFGLVASDAREVARRALPEAVPGAAGSSRSR